MVDQDLVNGLSAWKRDRQLCARVKCSDVGDKGGEQKVSLVLHPADLALSAPEPFGKLLLSNTSCSADSGEIDHHLYITSVLYTIQAMWQR